MAIARLLIEPSCIDEFVARVSGLITTHLTHVKNLTTARIRLLLEVMTVEEGARQLNVLNTDTDGNIELPPRAPLQIVRQRD